MTLNEQKIQAKELYRIRRENYMRNQTPENWKRYCEAKRYCMLLGVII